MIGNAIKMKLTSLYIPNAATIEACLKMAQPGGGIVQNDGRTADGRVDDFFFET